MQVQCYLFFEGRCEEAIEFYKRAISRNPADLKSYVDLAEQLVERNRQ